MTFSVSNGTAWVPTKDIHVSNGSGFVQAKSVKVSNGTAWVVAWVPPTTAAVTGPGWVLSTQSGAGGGLPSGIQPATFTISLSKPLSVQRVSFQMWHATAGWQEYGGWNSPTATSWTHVQPFSGNGEWKVRVVVTQLDGVVVTSAEFALTCYIKNLQSHTSDPAPVAGTTILLSPSCSADCAPGQSSQGWYYLWQDQNYDGQWRHYSNDGAINWPASGELIDWMYVENFPDGSTINSAPVRVDIQNPVAPPAHFHEVVGSGASAAQIQAAMDRAHNHFMAYQQGVVNFDDENTMACVVLVAGGVYDLGGSVLKSRRGVRLVGGGTGESRPTVYCKGSHFMNVDNNGGGGYNSPHYDWLVSQLMIDGFDTAGGFSIAHTTRYQISDCLFRHMGGKKHYIEANSSGGPRSDGTYNVRIIRCEFTNDINLGTRRVEDECVQLDYSWPGAASAVAGDGTVTNNVLVDACWFYNAPRAIGGHHFQSEGGNASPKGYHSNILIQNNTFQNIDPTQYNGGDAPNPITSEGAVRAYCWQNVHIISNIFQDCFQPVCLFIPNDCPDNLGHPTYFRIANNYFRGVVQDRYAIFGSSSDAVVRLSQVLIEGNVADGTWDTSPDIYFAGCDDTVGALAGVSESVHIRSNHFAPTNKTLSEEKAYNKYRAGNSSNATGVAIYSNTVSDGSVDNK